MDVMIDPADFRRVLGHYPTGVCVVTAILPDGRPEGMVVGSFTSASLDPPLVAFFPDKRSSTWPHLAAAERFCINVLAENQGDLCRQFASRGADRYAGVSHQLSPGGQPILDGVLAWIDCTPYAVHDAGDHHLVLGRVTGLQIGTGTGPLLFFQGGYGRFDRLPV